MHQPEVFYHIGDVHLATAIHSGNQHVGYLATGLPPTEAWNVLRLSLRAFRKPNRSTALRRRLRAEKPWIIYKRYFFGMTMDSIKVKASNIFCSEQLDWRRVWNRPSCKTKNSDVFLESRWLKTVPFSRAASMHRVNLLPSELSNRSK